MNENHWEQVKKKHSKRVLLLLLLLIFLVIIFGTIFLNNKDILSNNVDHKKNSSFNSDSGLVDFSTPDSDIDHFFGSADTSKKLNHTYSNEKGPKSDSGINQNKKVIVSIQQKTHDDKKNADTAPNSMPALQKNVILHADSGIVNEKSDNIKSSNWYSFVLPNVESMVSDRKDIIIWLALELFYNDSTETREILIKRDALRVVARKVIQRKELNSIRKEILSNELEDEMNMIFDKKIIQKVLVREFHIEKVDAQ